MVHFDILNFQNDQILADSCFVYDEHENGLQRDSYRMHTEYVAFALFVPILATI